MVTASRQFPLSRRQAELKAFIVAQLARGKSPTFEDMRIALHVRTRSIVHEHITQLERRGHIQRARLPGTLGRQSFNRIVAVIPDVENCPHCGRPVDA